MCERGIVCVRERAHCNCVWVVLRGGLCGSVYCKYCVDARSKEKDGEAEKVL